MKENIYSTIYQQLATKDEQISDCARRIVDNLTTQYKYTANQELCFIFERALEYIAYNDEFETFYDNYIHDSLMDAEALDKLNRTAFKKETEIARKENLLSELQTENRELYERINELERRIAELENLDLSENENCEECEESEDMIIYEDE